MMSSTTVSCLEDFHVITRFQLHGIPHVTIQKLHVADVLTLLFLLQVPGRHVSAVEARIDS